MDLPTVWFLLIAFFWAGYLVLEGFDFGVGMLLPFVTRDAEDRRVAVRTFGPVWDANEVWLIVAGGSMFAAFPNWYASMFQAMYLPLLLLLVALIVRVLAIEYRGQHPEHPHWAARWDRVLITSSFVAPIVIGLALSNVVRGIPLDAQHNFSGTLLNLVHPYALLGAATIVALYALHGATFLGLRAEGPVRLRAQRTALVVWPAALLLAGGFGLWTLLGTPVGAAGASPVGIGALIVAAGALAICGGAVWARREAVAFGGTAVAILAAGVLLFAQLWPNVLPSTDVAAGTLSIAEAASTPYTLKVMSVVVLVMLPVILLYQSWSYWVFRHRVLPEGFEQAKSPIQALEQRRAAEG